MLLRGSGVFVEEIIVLCGGIIALAPPLPSLSPGLPLLLLSSRPGRRAERGRRTSVEMTASYQMVL